MKMIQPPHHSVHIVLAHVILVKLPPTVTLVLKDGIYGKILVSKIVMNLLDYGTEMTTIPVSNVTSLVKLVMNLMKTITNVLHVKSMPIVLKEPLVNHISRLVSSQVLTVVETPFLYQE